tara:strand:- start:280 stop:399 length:120 start_codon:yes stop_codon:yes gene_type:complete
VVVAVVQGQMRPLTLDKTVVLVVDAEEALEPGVLVTSLQ